MICTLTLYKTSKSPQKPNFNPDKLFGQIYIYMKQKNLTDYDKELLLQQIIAVNTDWMNDINQIGYISQRVLRKGLNAGCLLFATNYFFLDDIFKDEEEEEEEDVIEV